MQPTNTFKMNILSCLITLYQHRTHGDLSHVEEKHPNKTITTIAGCLYASSQKPLHGTLRYFSHRKTLQIQRDYGLWKRSYKNVFPFPTGNTVIHIYKITIWITKKKKKKKKKQTTLSNNEL